MRISRVLALAGCVSIAVLSAAAQTSPNDAMRSCKNTAGSRMPNVPLAYISVSRGSDTGDGNYMINFRSQPPSGRASSGFCVISKYGQTLRFEFDPPIGGNPGGGYPGGGNNNYGNTSPEEAMRSCKNTAGSRLPNVPLAYISVSRGSNTGDGNYMINFRAQPPYGRRSSGFCIIGRNGQTRNFQFDPPPPPPGGNPGGQSFQDVMRSCKNALGSRFPRVPLAYISVYQPTINGGSLAVRFKVQCADQAPATGFCDVFKNGKVNLNLDPGR